MGSAEGAPKVAVVTGAAKGIWKGIAIELAKNNYHVAAVDVLEDGRSILEELKPYGIKAQYHAADVSDEEDVARTAKNIEASLGTPDLLVNNAGIFPRASAIDMPYSLFQKVLHVNLGGAFLCSRHFAPGMLKKEGARPSSTLRREGRCKGRPTEATMRRRKRAFLH